MKAEDVFRNLMAADELQTLLGIPKEEVASETYAGESSNATIEIIKDVIRGVENNKSEARIYQNITRQE